MAGGWDSAEQERRRREREMRESGADGRSRGYRGSGASGEYTGYEPTRSGAAHANVSAVDEALAGVPILGWLTGSDARSSEERARAEEEYRRQIAFGLGRSAPTAEELTPEYYLEGHEDAYGDLLGDPSAMHGWSDGQSRDALGQIGRAQTALQELMRGGMTQADRQALVASRLQQGQALQGANQAAIQQAGARGMGGGGAELAARLSGTQGYSNALAAGDASILGRSQDRALQAMQGYGQLGAAYGGIAGGMEGRDLQRRGAIDAYNQQNMDWRRGRNTRNTSTQNRQQDARMDARRDAYGMQERATAMAAGYNPYGAGSEDRRRGDEANQAAAGAIGAVISEIL